MSQTVFLGAAWCASMHGTKYTDRVVSGAKAAVRLCDTAQTSMALFDSELISDRYTPRTLLFLPPNMSTYIQPYDSNVRP